MKWAEVEASITLWIRHLELAGQTPFAVKEKLCRDVLGLLMESALWPECFTKIADHIMAVFSSFGEGVARSSKQPNKLFKLLDVFDALYRIRPQSESTFDG